MDVGIDETRHDKTGISCIKFLYINDFSFIDSHPAGKNARMDQIDDLSAQGKGIVAHDETIIMDHKDSYSFSNSYLCKK